MGNLIFLERLLFILEFLIIIKERRKRKLRISGMGIFVYGYLKLYVFVEWIFFIFICFRMLVFLGRYMLFILVMLSKGFFNYYINYK